ncbi:MAG: aryl-sulfate sulfotransferase [Ignavibacteriales bacterium]|nr:aryl-sulfate sulfotransferase [Ignavibacteriales bacterium]
MSENPHNVLSAAVQVSTHDAVAVKVMYGNGSLLDHQTPFVSVHENPTVIPVLGLGAETTYFLRVVAVSKTERETLGGMLSFTTGSLPDDLPDLATQASENPSPGYVMFGFSGALARSYAVLVDNQGTIVWYRRFEGSVTDFQRQESGTYTVSVTSQAVPTLFYGMDNLGTILRTYEAGGDRATGGHELRIAGTSYVLFGIEHRVMDLAVYGGLPTASVRGIIVEYQRSGVLPLLWNTFDHLEVTDAAADISLTGDAVNPWHGNAIEIDRDGNLLVSFRNCDEIIKVEVETGEMMWRLGGKNNQFEFIGDPLNGFSHQHGIRRLENDNIILFDNGNLHEPPESRAVEYQLDERNRKATLIWEYRSSPALFAFALGFAQRLENGNTLITYGTNRRIIEVDMNGTKRWELTVETPGHFVYRAFRVGSLY